MAIKLVLVSGVLCVAGAIAASFGWKSKLDSDGRRWELEESAAQLKLDNTRLARQVAAQLRSIALLRNECPIGRAALPAESAQPPREPSNTPDPTTAQSMVELRQVGSRVEVAPGGPMSPISD